MKKLFKVKVIRQELYDMPVCAESEEEALKWLNSTNEWKEDYESGSYKYGIRGISEVTHPAQCDFNVESICWSTDDEEVSVGLAFFGDPPSPPFLFDDDENYNEAEDNARWAAYWLMRDQLYERFNTEQSQNLEKVDP